MSGTKVAVGALANGHIWSLLRERQALLDIIDAARPVLEHVSAGRGYVDVDPYPDAAARMALGLIHDLDALEDTP